MPKVKTTNPIEKEVLEDFNNLESELDFEPIQEPKDKPILDIEPPKESELILTPITPEETPEVPEPELTLFQAKILNDKLVEARNDVKFAENRIISINNEIKSKKSDLNELNKIKNIRELTENEAQIEDNISKTIKELERQIGVKKEIIESLNSELSENEDKINNFAIKCSREIFSRKFQLEHDRSDLFEKFYEISKEIIRKESEFADEEKEILKSISDLKAVCKDTELLNNDMEYVREVLGIDKPKVALVVRKELMVKAKDVKNYCDKKIR